MIPNELILIIFNYISKITDKRFFSRTCNIYYNLTKTLVKLCEGPSHPIKIYTTNLNKYTWELCIDGYEHLIPKHYYNKKNYVICHGLIICGNLNLLQIAINNNCPLDQDSCIIAAKYGHLDIVQCAKNNNCLFTSSVCIMAAENGHLHIIIWALNNKCPWTNSISLVAAQYNHLHIIKWLHENNYELHLRLCEVAAQCGHLPILIWAKDNGLLRTDYLCDYSAEGGHLEVLKWARQNGSRWSLFTYRQAKYRKDANMIEWMLDNGLVLNDDNEGEYDSDYDID